MHFQEEEYGFRGSKNSGPKYSRDLGSGGTAVLNLKDLQSRLYI
jgi:hypothetical protein